MAEPTTSDLIIIGGGPAGYAAGIYAARAALDTVVIEQGMPGGQIATTDEVENYPGLPGMTGAELGMKFQSHAEALGVRSAYGAVEAISRCASGAFEVKAGSSSYTAPAVIIATGASPRTAGFVGEDTFRGRGISYCATCDGMFYRNKRVYVVGGGNAACEEGLFLANIASEVIMVVRRDEFRAPQGVVDRLLARDNVSVRFETSIVGVDGEALMTSITFRDTKTHEQWTERFDAGSVGIFVFAGTVPNSALVEDLVELGADGGIVTDESMATATPGLYAAGDVRAKQLRQVITAASDGAIAATSAYQYLTRMRDASRI